MADRLASGASVLKRRGSSNLPLGTIKNLWYNPGSPGGSNSVVECLLAKEDVASSSLVFRSIFILWRTNPEVRGNNGDVAKWQGGGLQNPYSPVRIRSSPPTLSCFHRL